MARMALAMPDAQQAAPAVAAQPETPMGAAMTVAQTSLQAGMAVASLVATLNPVAVAMTALAAATQVAGTTLQEANAVVAAAVPHSQAAPAVCRTSSPAVIPVPRCSISCGRRPARHRHQQRRRLSPAQPTRAAGHVGLDPTDAATTSAAPQADAGAQKSGERRRRSGPPTIRSGPMTSRGRRGPQDPLTARWGPGRRVRPPACRGVRGTAGPRDRAGIRRPTARAGSPDPPCASPSAAIRSGAGRSAMAAP